MINEDDFFGVLSAETPRAFLNLYEAYFKKNAIEKYIYIYLPALASFNADIAEIHHFGFEDNPLALNSISKFLRSSHCARRTKYVTAGLVKPFYSGSNDYKKHLSQTNNIIFPELDETQLCLYVPVHAGALHTGLFIFPGEQDGKLFFKDSRKIQILCQALHQRYCEIWISPDYQSLTFSLREREIMNWMAQGKSNSIIGELVGMSKHTVDAYLRTIYAKLSVSNRTAAAVKASELGFLQF